MCFVICTCCNSCNKYSSKCIEYSILIISSLSFIITLIGFFHINRDFITLLIHIIIIALMIFSFLILISIIFIVIWRYKQIINTKRNTIAEAFSVVGLLITIFYLIFIVSLMNLSYSNYQKINYPCSSFDRDESKIKSKSSTDDAHIPTFEENKDEFCIQNPDYFVDIVPLTEYIFSHVFSGILIIMKILLIYFWFNEFRRIKFLVDGPLNDFNIREARKKYKNNNEEEKENSNEKRVNERINRKESQHNNRKLQILYAQQEYGIRYDIYGRPIFILNKIKEEKENDKEKITINNIPTQRFGKRRSILHKRVSIFKGKNVIKQGKVVNFEIANSNSSDRSTIHKFKFSNNRRRVSYNNSAPKTKTTTHSALI